MWVPYAPMKARAVAIAVVLASSLLLGACGAGNSSKSSSSAAVSAVTTAATSAAAGPLTSTTSIAAVSPLTTTTAAPAAPLGPEDVPLEQGAELAPASSTAPGTTVDGIQCAPIEQLAYHIHAHLQVYVNGQPRQLPAAIGLIKPFSEQTADGPFYGAKQCYYWLHTHATDGIIHIESPTPRIYTLGNFFNEWRQPLSSHQVGPAAGKVTAFVNGKPWRQDLTSIPLEKHFVIQLDVGTPVVPFQTVSFGSDGL
jgi:hypothetical protein